MLAALVRPGRKETKVHYPVVLSALTLVVNIKPAPYLSPYQAPTSE
ncbi:MAG: hypothetical protein ACI81P_000730 [Neolewinella sp.]|jgi:hypothetical protein